MAVLVFLALSVPLVVVLTLFHAAVVVVVVVAVVVAVLGAVVAAVVAAVVVAVVMEAVATTAFVPSDIIGLKLFGSSEGKVDEVIGGGVTRCSHLKDDFGKLVFSP